MSESYVSNLKIRLAHEKFEGLLFRRYVFALFRWMILVVLIIFSWQVKDDCHRLFNLWLLPSGVPSGQYRPLHGTQEI